MKPKCTCPTTVSLKELLSNHAHREDCPVRQLAECKMRGWCNTSMDVACPYHGQKALKNKTGYYSTPPTTNETKE